MSKPPMTKEILEQMFLKENLTSSEIGERLCRAQNTVAKKLSEYKISKKKADGTFKKGFKKRDKKGKNTERIVQHLDGEIVKIWKSQKAILNTTIFKNKLHNRTLYNALNNFGQVTTRGFEWDYEVVFARKYQEEYRAYTRGQMSRKEKITYWTLELEKVWQKLNLK
jgi:IS30 family transposase